VKSAEFFKTSWTREIIGESDSKDGGGYWLLEEGEE
jgi:hypothetical protein